jgi:hypothetical protein
MFNMTKLTPFVTVLLATLASATPIDDRHGGGHHGPGCQPRPPHDGNCRKDVHGLQWTVHGFDYHGSYLFTNPAHQNSWGYVNFNLTNDVVPYTAVCEASSSQLTDFFYGTIDYACTLPADAPAGATVKFRFSRPSGQLDITESIICGEKKKYKAPFSLSSQLFFWIGIRIHLSVTLTHNRRTFVATGSTKLALECTDTTTVTPDWTPGQIYSHREIKCVPVDVTFHSAEVVG